MAVMLFLNFYLGFAWQDLLISALIGGGFFLVQFVISQGRWIGGGDIRLGFLMGLALGWPQIIAALMLAYSLGAFVGVVLIIFSRKKWDSQIPFGVFLTTATIIILFWGDFLVQWYWGLVGLT
jgi:prepilin signal peptidase PulO-like enzyme (type II secretory pathway)